MNADPLHAPEARLAASGLDADGHPAISLTRRRYYYGRRVFEIRLLGFGLMAILVAVHARLQPDRAPSLSVVILFPLLLLAYTFAARALVLRSLDGPGYRAAIAFAAAGDEALRLAAVGLSGAETSWLFPLLVVGVATHAFENPRRAAWMLGLTSVAYVAMVLLAAEAAGRVLPWTAAAANLLVLLVAGGFLVSLGRFAQSLRHRARRADATTRALMERLVQQNEALAGAKAVAERASEFKSNFLAGVSHELRTPLTSTRLTAQALQGEAAAAGRQDLAAMAKRIEESGERLIGMVNGLLDLAAIEAGKLKLHPEVFPTATLVEEVRLEVLPLAQQRRDLIQVDVSASPPEIQTDLQRLRQVLVNLLGNASKFTEGGTITLRVRAQEEEGREWVVFDVEDTGIGMTPDQLRGLFQAYTQAGPEIRRTYGGSGLGLSLSRELVGLLKGRITVASEPGKGSTFTVILPRWFEG